VEEVTRKIKGLFIKHNTQDPKAGAERLVLLNSQKEVDIAGISNLFAFLVQRIEIYLQQHLTASSICKLYLEYTLHCNKGI
jgi:hypothetical protein